MAHKVFSKNVLASALLFANFAASAAVVVVEDGDLNDYDPLNTYEFSAELTLADPTVTFGFNLDLGEGFDFEVTAPPEFDLIAKVTTQPDFGGFTIIATSDVFSRVLAGTSFVFPISADTFASFEHWLTISVDGIPEAVPFLPISIGSVGGPVSAPVPLPPAVWLFGSALIGLLTLRRPLRSKQLVAA